MTVFGCMACVKSRKSYKLWSRFACDSCLQRCWSCVPSDSTCLLGLQNCSGPGNSRLVRERSVAIYQWIDVNHHVESEKSRTRFSRSLTTRWYRAQENSKLWIRWPVAALHAFKWNAKVKNMIPLCSILANWKFHSKKMPENPTPHFLSPSVSLDRLQLPQAQGNNEASTVAPFGRSPLGVQQAESVGQHLWTITGEIWQVWANLNLQGEVSAKVNPLVINKSKTCGPPGRTRRHLGITNNIQKKMPKCDPLGLFFQVHLHADEDVTGATPVQKVLELLSAMKKKGEEAGNPSWVEMNPVKNKKSL